MMAECGLGGIVYVSAATGDGPASERIRINRIDVSPFVSAPRPPAMAEPKVVPVVGSGKDR